MISGSAPVWVEDRKVIEVLPSGNQFQLKAQSRGISEIRFRNRSYEVFVISHDQERTLRTLNPVLPGTLQLELQLKRDQLSLSGRLVRWSDWLDLANACQEKNCDYLFTATMSSYLRKEIQSKIEGLLQSEGLPIYSIQLAEKPNQKTFVKLPQDLKFEKRLMGFFRRFGIDVEREKNFLATEPLIETQIILAEVKKQSLLSYGVQWPSQASSQLLPSYQQFKDAKGDLSLQALEIQGEARVLASPNILSRSGHEAEFFAGGEFPIKVVTMKIQSVIWKKYGLLMKVKPQADPSGKMKIQLETEISSLDMAHAVDGVPAIYKNQVQSQFELNEPRTIILSGLVKSESGESSQGLPLLSRIPILSSLFSSQDFMKNKTELLIFVRPSIVTPENLRQKEVF